MTQSQLSGEAGAAPNTRHPARAECKVKIDPSYITKAVKLRHFENLAPQPSGVLAGDWDLEAHEIEWPDGRILSFSEEHGHGFGDIVVAIDRNGWPLLLAGSRRLAWLKHQGLPYVDARVALRHHEWFLFRQEIYQFAEANQPKAGVYNKLPHFDFDDLAVHSYHDDSREKLILPFLRGQIGKTGRLLDIGANWGHMCHFLEDKGFTCTAIEANADCCYFMNRLKVAGQKTFEVQCVNVFNMEHLHMFDAVCALNIFHHFLKKSKSFIKFLELLGRIHCKAMVFQAHSENEDQMRKAFVDYRPRDFAEMVRIHAKFDHWRELGQADGRMIFGLYKNKA